MVKCFSVISWSHRPISHTKTGFLRTGKTNVGVVVSVGFLFWLLRGLVNREISLLADMTKTKRISVWYFNKPFLPVISILLDPVQDPSPAPNSTFQLTHSFLIIFILQIFILHLLNSRNWARWQTFLQILLFLGHDLLVMWFIYLLPLSFKSITQNPKSIVVQWGSFGHMIFP